MNSAHLVTFSGLKYEIVAADICCVSSVGKDSVCLATLVRANGYNINVQMSAYSPKRWGPIVLRMMV